MTDDIKDYLARRAEEMRLDPRVPERVVRRARRRRAAVSAVGGLMVVALLSGSYGLFRLTGRTEAPIGPADPSRQTTPSIGPQPPEWIGVWPDRTREEAETAQACADADDQSCTWRIRAATFLETFAVQALDWAEFSIGLWEPDDGDLDDATQATVSISDCPPETACFEGHQVDVSIERLIRPDETGVWSVTALGQVKHYTDVLCGNCPIEDQEVESFVLDFLARRHASVGAEAYLSAGALEQYRAHVGGLVLYAFESDSHPEGFEVISVHKSGDRRWAVEVRVEVSPLEDDAITSIREALEVTQTGQPTFEGTPFIVVGAERLE